MTEAYEVIVVGGRPSGATLAARLGKQGVRTLLLERSALPSLPAISSPIIYASTMALLDEIGAREAAYAHNTPKIQQVAQVISDELRTAIQIPESYGRSYAYAVDRARFDAALWDAALRYSSVTGWQQFAVTDLLWETDSDGREKVVGIVGHGEDKQEQHIYAKLVIGADGRFSLVARKTDAQVRDEHTENPTSLYYAYWKGVKPYDSGSPTAAAYAGAEPGYGYLVMDSADDTAAVTIEGQSALLTPPPGKVEDYYVDLLRRSPLVWPRLQTAEMVTTVRGIRDVGNLYRQPGGPGWALVGDAYHQKDPLDGQGIYDAVYTAKALAYAIKYWRSGEKTWDEALEWYDETVRIRTFAAYRSVLDRVKSNLYAPAPPEWMLKTMNKWLLEDRRVQELMGKFLTRQIPADALTLMTPPVLAGAVVRGGLRELRDKVLDRLGLNP